MIITSTVRNSPRCGADRVVKSPNRFGWHVLLQSPIPFLEPSTYQVRLFDCLVLTGLCDSGLLVSALWIFGSSKIFTRSQRLKGAHLLGTMADDHISGGESRDVCQLLLTVEFDNQILGAVNDPEMLVEYFDQDHDSPVIYWNEGCRR